MERRCGIGMLGQRLGTPRWADDTAWSGDEQCLRTGQEAESPSEGRLTVRGTDRGGIKIAM